MSDMERIDTWTVLGWDPPVRVFRMPGGLRRFVMSDEWSINERERGPKDVVCDVIFSSEAAQIPLAECATPEDAIMWVLGAGAARPAPPPVLDALPETYGDW